MNIHDFAKLPYEQLMKRFEKERQEWLAAGMSESAIHRIHFGEEDEKGKGGDYRIWLDEIPHTSAKHKYAPGAPVSADTANIDGGLCGSKQNEIADAEFGMEFEAALSTLTVLQRFCFVSVKIKDRTQQSVADELGVRQQNVDNHIRAAVKKLQKYFQGTL